MTPWETGTQLGPYTLVGLVGQGGMGEVWKAHDTRLGRFVAIKRLTAGQNTRFAQEARTIAALNHPYICTLHDIGPDYLVMEFVEGEPLVPKDQTGPLPAADALRFAAQIAEALEEAHRKGIIHRDLKPGNIFRTRTGIKVLDFGLAKLNEHSDPDATKSLEGVAMGTPAYMSPEQARGEPVDARSDIFSFGAVLYEMLSGRRPFGGGSTVEILSAVLRDEPRSLEGPAAAIVARCLRKNPAERFASATELRAELQKSPPAGSAQPSIAVLPFANISGDQEQEYFSDGLAEEIINLLAHIPGLKVIARTSAFAFKGKNEDIRNIAATLGVAHILEGSVRRAGSQIRVTAQLIHAGDGSHLWSERYDRELTNVFAIQDEIAQAITAALQVKISPKHAPPERYQPNLPAYEAYLKARHHWAKFTPEGLERCRNYYQQAIALDPGYGLAHVGLADYFLSMTTGLGVMPAHQAMPLVRALALKALEVDPSLPEAHAMLGIVTGVYDFDWNEAERRFRLAMAKEPVPGRVRQWFGYFYLLPTGRAKEAVEQLEKGVQEDPLSLMARTVFAIGLFVARRLEDAIAECHRMLEFDKDYWVAHTMLAVTDFFQGKLREALAIAEKVRASAPWYTAILATYAGAQMRLGETRKANEVIQGLLANPDVFGTPRTLSMYYFICGDLESASLWLEKALAQRDAQALLAEFNILRASPHWPQLAKMINLPESG